MSPIAIVPGKTVERRVCIGIGCAYRCCLAVEPVDQLSPSERALWKDPNKVDANGVSIYKRSSYKCSNFGLWTSKIRGRVVPRMEL